MDTGYEALKPLIQERLNKVNNRKLLIKMNLHDGSYDIPSDLKKQTLIDYEEQQEEESEFLSVLLKAIKKTETIQ